MGSYMMQYLYHGFDSPISYKPEDRSKAAAAYNRAQFDRLLRSRRAWRAVTT